MILDAEIFENFLQLQDEVRSAAALVAIVLKVYGVIDAQTQFHLVDIFDLLHEHTVVRTPELRFAF